MKHVSLFSLFPGLWGLAFPCFSLMFPCFSLFCFAGGGTGAGRQPSLVSPGMRKVGARQKYLLAPPRKKKSSQHRGGHKHR